jgi:hypothetical protein
MKVTNSGKGDMNRQDLAKIVASGKATSEQWDEYWKVEPPSPALNSRRDMEDDLERGDHDSTDLSDLVAAVDTVREAVRSQHTWVSSAFWIWIAWTVFSFLQTSVWESKFRYAMYYDVPSEHITLLKKPHDCEFLKAPIGSKECHFDKNVEVTKVGKDTKTGRPVVSHNSGKTWDWDDSTDIRSVPSVWVSYTRVEDENE